MWSHEMFTPPADSQRADERWSVTARAIPGALNDMRSGLVFWLEAQ